MDKNKNGSRGRIRTYDQVINSHLRYRCATREYSWSTIENILAELYQRYSFAGVVIRIINDIGVDNEN